jgi:hypothetical protein
VIVINLLPGLLGTAVALTHAVANQRIEPLRFARMSAANSEGCSISPDT